MPPKGPVSNRFSNSSNCHPLSAAHRAIRSFDFAAVRFIQMEFTNRMTNNKTAQGTNRNGGNLKTYQRRNVPNRDEATINALARTIDFLTQKASSSN